VTGTPSGFLDLDRLTAGFQPGNLVVVAARPSMGKSALVLGIAAHIAAPSATAPRRACSRWRCRGARSRSG
jgi:replicative DNA helicase